MSLWHLLPQRRLVCMWVCFSGPPRDALPTSGQPSPLLHKIMKVDLFTSWIQRCDPPPLVDHTACFRGNWHPESWRLCRMYPASWMSGKNSLRHGIDPRVVFLCSLAHKAYGMSGIAIFKHINSRSWTKKLQDTLEKETYFMYLLLIRCFMCSLSCTSNTPLLSVRVIFHRKGCAWWQLRNRALNKSKSGAEGCMPCPSPKPWARRCLVFAKASVHLRKAAQHFACLWGLRW